VIVKTGSFGQITVGDGEIITIPQGILGFPDYRKYCLIDSGDDTLVLWLQSMEDPAVAFPVLEPKIFKPDYTVKLSAAELRELKLGNINQSTVLSILTIPADITQMSANIKAPIVINLKEQIARQVVLQENEYGVKHPMFSELRVHLMTLKSRRMAAEPREPVACPVAIKDIPPALTVKSLA